MRKISSCFAFWLICLLLCSFSIFSLTVLAADQTVPTSNNVPLEIWPVNDASEPDESSILLRYQPLLGGLREDMPHPSLTIYQDGYIRVFYPDYMKQGGIYVARLNPANLEALWRKLTDPRLLKFDAQKIRNEMSLLERSRGERPSRIQDKSDEVTAVMEYYPNRHPSHPISLPDRLDEKKVISWYGLKSNAMRYASVTEIQQFYEICEQLDAIMSSDQFRKIP